MQTPMTQNKAEGYLLPNNTEASPRIDGESRGGLLVYLSTLLSRLVQELSHRLERSQPCALCPDLILPTQPTRNDQNGFPAHAMCMEMKFRKTGILEAVKSYSRSCPICSLEVFPQDVYFHDGGATVSYVCGGADHREPHFFSSLLATDESRWVGMWEARLRKRMEEKGSVRCCECGRHIPAGEAKSLSAGWNHCGCLPELWRAGP